MESMNRRQGADAHDTKAQESVLVLDDPDLWNNPQFRSKLLCSLECEGFEKASVDLVRDVFEASGTPDFEAFQKSCQAYCREHNLGEEAKGLLDAVIAHWEQVRVYNTSVYRPRSVDDYKNRYWPNNPKLLQTNWEYHADIHDLDMFVEPNRFITESTPIVSAGSCFAANISRQLQHWNYNYLIEMGPTKDQVEDPRKYTTDSAGCGNIYNAMSMRQMVERAFGEWEPEKILVTTRLKYLDPFRSITDFDDLDSYAAKSREHSAALTRALTKCEVFVLTLGMTEAWVFADTGLATSTSPVRGDPTLIRHKQLSVADNVRELERIYELFKKHNPKAKFITTVSPVPLNATFRNNQHVVVANGLSKATLRVALEDFSNAHPEDVFYFPSYEIVTSGTREPWEIDMRHVSNAAVERVMGQFQKQFMVSQEPLEILKVAELQEYIPMRHNPMLRALREYFVHPVKRMLGIEGQPFRAILNRAGRPGSR